ncbi:MAG: DUF1360 domain-containing protein [Solirubrobacterales bacterium]
MSDGRPDLSSIDAAGPSAPRLPAPENLRAGPDAGSAQYGAINAVHAALFAGLLLATRGRDADAERLAGVELLPLTAATFSISKIVAREKVGSWVREPFVEDPVGRKRPRGGRLQRALGELVTCSRCVGAWTALGLVGVRLAHPRTGRTVTAVFAAAGLNDFMQAGFRGLCDWANTQRR